MIINLKFDLKKAERYQSPSQRIRVLTEDWVNREIYCPACGSSIMKIGNNRPVLDFCCSRCLEQFELKSKNGNMGIKIVDGAYKTMIERLKSVYNPNFFFLNYILGTWEVVNFLVIPKHFFTPEIIESRKPLSADAQRHNWVGCNILLHTIPISGKIFFIRDKNVEPRSRVIENWKKTLFLRETRDIDAKGWILSVMQCIDRLSKREFTLDEVYDFEEELKSKYPSNKHIKDKIRQQLQILRDRGYLEFRRRGGYRVL